MSDLERLNGPKSVVAIPIHEIPQSVCLLAGLYAFLRQCANPAKASGILRRRRRRFEFAPRLKLNRPHRRPHSKNQAFLFTFLFGRWLGKHNISRKDHCKLCMIPTKCGYSCVILQFWLLMGDEGSVLTGKNWPRTAAW